MPMQMAFTGGEDLATVITKTRRDCAAAMGTAGGQQPSHEQFVRFVLDACRQAAEAPLFPNDVACFRLPPHIDSHEVRRQLKAGGFLAECPYGGLLKIGWDYDAARAKIERARNDEHPDNVAKVQELQACISRAVEHMGLTFQSVNHHLSTPQSAIALFSWAPE